MASLSQEDAKDPGASGGSQLRRHGSIRKVLPSVPDVDTQLSMAAKMIDRRNAMPRASHSYEPYFLEYSLLAEYGLLEKQKLPGIYVIPAASVPLQWFGVMFIRQGAYLGGAFKFTIHIPDNYPDGDCPDVVFNSFVYHPQIDPASGALDVKKGFQKWRRNVNHLWHLLLYARRIFYKIDFSEPSNVEAAKLYENDVDGFQAKVKECVKLSRDRLYDKPHTDDAHAIRFSPWNPSVHGELRQTLLGHKSTDAESPKNFPAPGLSWVQKGSLQIFSKEKMMS